MSICVYEWPNYYYYPYYYGVWVDGGVGLTRGGGGYGAPLYYLEDALIYGGGDEPRIGGRLY